MNVDIEKLRNELKNKIDEILDSYISENNEEDNTLAEIPEENIYMEFDINNQDYIAFSEDSEENEELNMMFAKVDIIYGNKILRNIETSEEYESVLNEFNRRLVLIEDGEV